MIETAQRSGLGARVEDGHVIVSVYSRHASAMDVCIFESASTPEPRRRVAMRRSGDSWTAAIEGGPGLVYGVCADGPWQPERGHWFNPALTMFDPYGRAFAEPFSWSHGRTPRAVVVDSTFDWKDDRSPRTPWADTVVYEMHVKGFTARHPQIPPHLRGTYAGLATAPAIEHLESIGVTAVELLPVHARVDERALFQRGLSNYWGYNTLGYFAPEPRLAAATTPQGVVNEFKHMVAALHRAGIEVWLDVVYNHTAEGDHVGSTMCFRGLDNRSYYRCLSGDLSRYEDFTGCGNTLDTRQPVVRQLILDSLRYWVEEMHVDGFRFDLASALARGDAGFESDAPILRDIRADPTLTSVKLIAEPWDATSDGYRVGGFPAGWAEWNGRYRDDVRRYWRGDHGMRAALATRVAGSSDLYNTRGRGPTTSINFVTSHDGFTLRDLVSYREKHNHSNGEDNRDGESHNHSTNHGVEGPSADPQVEAARARHQRNLLATLFLSAGVPMMNGGDELGRTQDGNNNAYCHDSELTWTPWLPEHGADLALLDFVRALAAFRRETRALRRTTFYRPDDGSITWRDENGRILEGAIWDAGAPLEMDVTDVVKATFKPGEEVQIERT